jgi:hypothetical protein
VQEKSTISNINGDNATIFIVAYSGFPVLVTTKYGNTQMSAATTGRTPMVVMIELYFIFLF